MNTSPQYTKEWYQKRWGKWNGSEIGTLMQHGKGNVKFGQTAITYILKVASERKYNLDLLEQDYFFGQLMLLTDSSNNKYCNWGHDMEPNAIKYYLENYLGDPEAELVSLDSCVHPDYPNIAASPDGMVIGKDGKKHLIEVKCPIPTTFMRYKVQVNTAEDLKKVNSDYYWQTQAELSVVPDAEYIDWISFCPFMEDPIHVVRIFRNKEDMDELISRVNEAENVIKEFPD